MKKLIVASYSLLLPVMALAQDISGLNPNIGKTGVSAFIVQVNSIINIIIPFIIGLAVLIVIWGVFGYITSAGDEEKRGEAKQHVIWGIIGIFIMLSVWGFVSILANTFNLDKGVTTGATQLKPTF